MHHRTFFTSILILTLITQITAQKCLLYNTLSLPVIYHDICVTGSCMNATTFMPDFDIPLNNNNNAAPNGYRNIRTVNGYQQNFCAAITLTPATDLSLRPQGCNSAGCTDTACGFNTINGYTRGLVQSTLVDGLPVWRNNKVDATTPANGIGFKSIASAATFNKWYHDSSSTIRIESQLNLTRKGHTQTFQYEQPLFFPLDGKGYWNYDDKQNGIDLKPHNFGFTTAIISEFVYTGGENFTFRGDDDVWVFIDNKLAIDIGGLHPAECRAIILDEAANGGVGKVYTCATVESTVNAGNARAGETYTIPGLTIGSRHTLSIFHAERHEEGSSFAMSTSIGFNAGDTGGLDYNLPSATGARIYIGTYQFIALGQVDSAPEPIQLPVYTGTPRDTPITITLEFPPVAVTQIACRILQLSPTAIASLRLTEVDRNTIAPPLGVTFVKATENQATWASIIAEADHLATNCTANSKDQPSWTITVRTTGAGSGHLYCIAVDVPGVAYSDYTAAGRARDTNFYRQWVATSITSLAPPTTLPPTTEPPTTLPPTTEAPTTEAPTTEAPTTQPPSTAAPTTEAPVITTQPPTTESPTNAATTAPPTTATVAPTNPPTTDNPTTQPPTPTATTAPTSSVTSTPTTTETPTTQPPTPTATTTPTPTPTVTSAPTNTLAPTTDAPTNPVITTSPPTSTSTPTSGVTTNPPTSTSTPTSGVTTAPPTSTSAPTMTVAPTNVPTSTPTPTPTPTTSVPTSTVSPTTNPTDVPTSTPTPSSSSTGVPVSSVVSSETSTIGQLQFIVPVAVAGVIVLVALVWGSIICWKRRQNGVLRTHGSHMEMV